MNKQEIEKALSWVKEVINHQVFKRATYEDTYGTGDLSEEERKEVYEEMDNNINLFKTIQCALIQQLNNGWIPVSERLPKENGHYLVTYHEWTDGNYLPKYDDTKVKILRYQDAIFRLPVCCDKQAEQDTHREVLAWQPLPEPYKED
mgnify:FL=1